MTTHTHPSYTVDKWQRPPSQRRHYLSLFIASGRSRALLALVLTAGIWVLTLTVISG